MKKVIVSGPLSFCGAPVPISCARAEGALISACLLSLYILVAPYASTFERDLLERLLLGELYMDLSDGQWRGLTVPCVVRVMGVAVNGENDSGAVVDQDGGAVGGPTDVITDLCMRCK